MNRLIKDPVAILDYGRDFSEWLEENGDTINGHSVSVSPSGLTIDSTSHSATAVIAWVSGGTVGAEYTLDFQITTTGGRKDSRQLVILVQDR